MALVLDLMGGRLLQKELVAKGAILGHFFGPRVPKGPNGVHHWPRDAWELVDKDGNY